MTPELAREIARIGRQIQQQRRLEETRLHKDEIREACKEFAEFVRRAWVEIEPETELVWGWHLDAMCMHLQAISLGTLHPRLICNISPGSSKSTIFTVLWQAYEWGPLGMRGKKFLSTSYEISNVNRDTRKTRDLIESEWYRTLWPEVALKRRAESSFENTRKGTREGVPFGSLTSKRGDRLIIDDPHSLEGAESEVERTKAVRRFVEGGQNRVNDQVKSAIVIVMQRLHERDLTGELLARELGYIHLMIPMELEIERRCVTPIWQDPRTVDGELMDKRRMPQSAVNLLKKDNDYMWAGQYQQRPAPREGGMFKVEKITGEDNALLVDHVPPGAIRVRGWDIAGSSRKTSPFTAGVKFAWLDPILYIEHVVRERAEIDIAERLIVQTCHDDGLPVKQSIPQDPGSAGKSQKVHLSGKLAGLDFNFSTETGTKEDRAIPLASQVNAGCVRMVKGPWNGPFIEEMRNFPAGAYKDQIDAASRAYQEIAKMMTKPRRLPAGAMILNGE